MRKADELLLPGDALLLHLREGALELRQRDQPLGHPRARLPGAFAVLTRPRVPYTTVVLLGFFAAFVVVYLIGFYNLDSADGARAVRQGARQVPDPLHVPRRRGRLALAARPAYYWRALAWFCAGVAVNALYGVAQLLVAPAGGNLDSLLVSPLTGGASQINIYGAVNGSSVYRPNALTGDPNHLGIMLIVPLLVLTPLYLRLERGHRLRRRLALLIGFLLVVEASTLSRSGLLGLGIGAIVLALPYRRYLRSRALLAPLAGALAVLGAVVVSRLHFFEVVLRSRVQTGGGSQSAHFQVYSFVPQILHSHPLFGLGLNNFSIYYEFVTGKTNWGPHSFYVSLIVETGLVGTVLFAVFLLWVFLRLRDARARPGADAGARPARRPRPPARLGLDGGARRDDGRERLLPDDAVLLLLRVPGARARGAARLRDRPEREPDRERNGVERSEHGHEPVVEAELTPRQVALPPDTRAQEPGGATDRVHVLQPFDAEPCSLELGAEVAFRVAALVTELSVERAEQGGVRGDDQQQRSLGREQLVEAGQRGRRRCARGR